MATSVRPTKILNALYKGTVGKVVRLDCGFLHLSKEAPCVVHLATAHASVNERVEGHIVRLQSAVLHSPEHVKGLFKLLELRASLDDCVVRYLIWLH